MGKAFVAGGKEQGQGIKSLAAINELWDDAGIRALASFCYGAQDDTREIKQGDVAIDEGMFGLVVSEMDGFYQGQGEGESNHHPHLHAVKSEREANDSISI